MQNFKNKWETRDFSKAMKNAVEVNSDHKYLKVGSDKILFNGFWRNGNNQNLCLWLDKATWHDAKTGDGGGCKEFAKTAFNMSLTDFMHRYGTTTVQISEPNSIKDDFDKPQNLTKTVHEVWLGLQKNDRNRSDLADEWLKNKRGFNSPRQIIGSGFANLGLEDLGLFEPQHHKLIQQRLALGPQIVAPLRGVNSDQVQNLFFRSISECSKEEKSRLLTGAGGWGEPGGSPRAFGFPHLIHDFPKLVLCEGMADYFAAECLLGDEYNFLPLGAASASALPKWARWLIDNNYYGRLIIVPQLDQNSHGQASAKEIGQKKAVEALRFFKTAKKSSHFFNWPLFLRSTSLQPQKITDLADIISVNCQSKEYSFENLQTYFRESLKPWGKN